MMKKPQKKQQVVFTMKQGADQTPLSRTELKIVLGGNEPHHGDIKCW